MQLNRKKQSRAIVWAVWGWIVLAQAGSEAVAQDAQQKAVSEAGQEKEHAQKPASFDLLELRVKGNTLLDKKQLERVIYPFLGPKKSLENVDLARAALENLYRAKGYQTVSVDIPEQEVKSGVVYLQVVEGKVSRLRVTDSRYFLPDKIKAGVPELAEGNVPNFPKMQAQLTALSGQSADRKIQPVLRAGDTPGTLEVDLKVKDKLPLHGRLELNGRNTSSTSVLRLVSSLHYDNLWQAQHSASLMYQVSPQNSKQVDVWAGTYALPLFNTDTRLALYGVNVSSTANVANVGGTTVIGAGSIFGLRVVKPLKGLDNYFHTATLGVDYKDFKQDVSTNSNGVIKTPIAYLPFLAEYSGNWRSEESLVNFNLGLHFSIRGLGNNQAQFEDKRYLAQANYMYLRGDMDFRHDLPLGMQLNTRFAGQVADSPIISNEQFSLGGMESVRGYFETMALADDAVFGSFELYSPHLGSLDWDYLNNLKVLAFVDGAQGWVQNPLPGNVSGYTLAGTGFGMRFQMWKLLSGALDIGIPLFALQVVNRGSPHVHFRVATEF